MVATAPTAPTPPNVKTPKAGKAAKKKLTYADYCAMTPEGAKFQLLDGELIEMPSPTDYHQEVFARIFIPLFPFVEDNRLGAVRSAPLDVILTDNDTVQPDILFVSNERNHIRVGGKVYGAPDLVVEILSPSTAGYDLGYKMDLYARHGAKEYWIGDCEAETIRVLLLVNGAFVTAGVYGKGDTLTSPTLPGFSLDIDNVF